MLVMLRAIAEKVGVNLRRDEQEEALSEETKPQRLVEQIKELRKISRLEARVKRAGVVSLILMLTSGCVVVGGYSSGRGWYLWPGTIVIFLVFALIFLILRRS